METPYLPAGKRRRTEEVMEVFEGKDPPQTPGTGSRNERLYSSSACGFKN